MTEYKQKDMSRGEWGYLCKKNSQLPIFSGSSIADYLIVLYTFVHCDAQN